MRTPLPPKEAAHREALRLISRKEAARRADISISTQKRLEKLGLFPRKVVISEGRVGFVEAEVAAWIAERVADRDEVAA